MMRKTDPELQILQERIAKKAFQAEEMGIINKKAIIELCKQTKCTIFVKQILQRY